MAAESASSRVPEWLRARAAAVLLAIAAGSAAQAQTTVRGLVTDQTTGVPLSGVHVEIRRGAAVVAPAVSDAAGRWQITADLGNSAQAQNLKLLFSRDAYTEAARDLVVASGAALTPAVDVALQRRAVADCQSRLARPRRVVVAHFMPPSQGPANDAFAERVAHALRAQLLFLEQSRLAAPLQHSVVACAQLDDADNLVPLARELKADALMGGQVALAGAGPRYNVTMQLRDAHGLFDGQPPIRSTGVDLDDASASRLAPEALAGVVQALVTGHQKEQRHAECVQLANLALAALPRSAVARLTVLRDECLRQQPARGLVRGAAP